MRSGGATILSFIELDESEVSSFCVRFSDTREHGDTTGEGDIAVKITTVIDIALEDRAVSRLVDARSLETEQGRLEERLGRAEPVESKMIRGGEHSPESGTDLPLVADGDDLTIGELVALLERG